jgi:hypothetical protein
MSGDVGNIPGIRNVDAVRPDSIVRFRFLDIAIGAEDGLEAFRCVEYDRVWAVSEHGPELLLQLVQPHMPILLHCIPVRRSR